MINNSDLVVMCIILAFLLVFISGLWLMFEKANYEGWKSLIPIYNLVILFQILNLNPWLLLLYCTFRIPVIGLIICIILHLFVSFKITSFYSQKKWFIIGLFFFTPIFYVILGFGNAKYSIN